VIVASIVLSLAFTLLTVESLGLLLLAALRPKVCRLEQYTFAFVCGAAVSSIVVFLTAALHVVSPSTFMGIGVASVSVCAYRRAYRPLCSQSAEPSAYAFLFAFAAAPFAVLYGLHALAPEASPDGSAYHLGLVRTYLDQHGFGRITTNMYANMPLGLEMLFLYAFAFGGHSAAALVHFSFLVVLPLLMIGVGRRFGHLRGASAAALFVFVSPVFGIDASSAYVDVAAACVVFALFAVLQVWAETADNALLPLAGLLAGFAYTVKMTTFVAVPYALVFLAYTAIRKRRPVLQPLTLAAGCASAMIAPWLLKNWFTVANPFSPFLNQWFPNPYIRISFEQGYRESLRSYPGLESMWDIPMEVTMLGATLNGLLGPVFLLAPIGLLAMRWPLGRQALLAAAVYLSTYPANVGTRFLLPAAPFVALAIGMVLAQWRGIAPMVMMFATFASWPGNVEAYASPYAWRVDRFLWAGAFRWQPESEYLMAWLPNYEAAPLIERSTGPRDRILVPGNGIPEAYCARTVVQGYQSAYGNRLVDLIATGMYEVWQPRRWWWFEFPTRGLRRIRLVRAAGDTEPWTMYEIRIFGTEGELTRETPWRGTASANRWEAAYAFDGVPVTRWTAAERSRPGMFIEVDLGADRMSTGVRAEVNSSERPAPVRLEAEIDGRWVLLSDEAKVLEAPLLTESRRQAGESLKREGITHMYVHEEDWMADDIRRNPAAWGLILIGESGKSRVYRLE
jgi:hypothetical protein